MTKLEKGKGAVEKILRNHGEILIVTAVNETWAERKRSNLVKFMLTGAEESVKTISKCFDISDKQFWNKLTNDSFSFTDLMAVAYACDYSFQIVSNEDGARYLIEPVDYLRTYDEELLQRIEALREKKTSPEYAEYLRKKAELEEMKKRYGFDD